MPPPGPVGALEAAIRVLAGCLVCGGTLPLLHALVSHVDSAQYIVLGAALAALGGLGAARALCTHRGKRRLAMQTAALALPCAISSYLAGQALAAHVVLR